MRRCIGFTLVELLVVMAIIATLLTLVAPRYIQSVDRSREAVLRTNLKLLRSAIDQHYADRGAYPESLAALVDRRYIRELPEDPISERRDTWVAYGHPGGLPGVFEVRSGASGNATDGSAYASW
jgi:prepilin-type N-terminal cleavage/methylation domain-containing protein